MPDLTPKDLADELRAARLLELMLEDPSRTQDELCDLLGIGSRNTLVAIMKGDFFQRMVSELRGSLLARMTAQLAKGVPDVLDYQLAVGSGRIGEQVRDHVAAGRVVREFLTLLVHATGEVQPQRERPVFNIFNALTNARVDRTEVVRGPAPSSDIELVGYS